MPALRQEVNQNIVGHSIFFLICLSHDSIANHYQTNFVMMQNHQYSLNELDNMLPWERQIYIALLQEHIKLENERIKNANQG
jgi:hypothetical protein